MATGTGKSQGFNRTSRHPQQNQRYSHIPNESMQRSQQGFPIQNVMMPGQRQGSFVPGHAIAMAQRPMRGRVYQSSAQGHSPMQGFIPQQNMQYQVVGQDPYGQPVMRSYIPNVQPAYQMQATSAPFQPQYMPQQPQYFNPGMTPAMYYTMPNNQQIQQQQNQQQQQPPAQTTNPQISATNANKPKPKRSSKIVIRDPKDHKDVTDEILSIHNNTTNGRPGGTPPLTSAAQTESSTIQAQFAAQVAARVGEKATQSNEKKSENGDKDKKLSAKTEQTDVLKSDLNKQGKESVATDQTHSKELSPKSSESPSTTNSLTHENGTDSPKSTVGDTHVNQSSPTLGEMTEKMKMTLDETQKEPKVVLRRADTDAAKNEESEIKEKATDASEGETSKDSENVGKEETVSKNVDEDGPEEPVKNDNNDNSLDNTESGVDPTRTSVVEGKLTSVSSDTTETKVEAEVNGSESKQEDESQSQDQQLKQEESPKEIVSQPSEPEQQNQEVIDNKDKELQQDKLSDKQQADKQQQQKQPEEAEDKQLKEDKQDDKIQQDKLPDKEQLHKEQPLDQQPVDSQQQEQEKQQKEKQQEDSNKQHVVSKEQKEPDKLPPKQEKPKSPEKQLPQQQHHKEPPKKKSSRQRFKDMNKKDAGGDLMDAYTDKPPPEPVVEENVQPVEIIPEESDKPLEEDLSWEDKGEKIGDEIKVEAENDTDAEAPAAEQIKRKYERDFLLQFQYMPVCTEKPAGLPEIEVVLDAPVPPGKGGGSQRGSDFLPSYARQKSQGGGGGRRDSRGKPPARKIINAAPAPPVVLKQSENRWQRPEEKEKELTEEGKKSAELYRNVVAILNKLTPQKFKSLVEQVMALNIDTPERLEGVIDRIFEKAVGEPVFSVAYANMCRCLFTIKVSDAEGKDVSFRKLLLNRCQKEFEKEKQDEQALLEKNNQLEGLSEEEKKVKKEEMDEALSKNKRRMLGNIKFIGELFKLKLLTENIMHDCIFKLLRAGDEESLESMCKLLSTIGKDLDSDKAKPRIEQYFDQINKIIINKKVSSRVIFMLRDVVELRDNKWIPRREENYNPKTIDQIHKEAEMEKKEEKRLAAQLPSKDNKQKKGGQGGRDSPKPTANDGWITTGKGGKSAPIDQNKLRSIAKRANNEEVSLGPPSRFGQWGRGSSAGNNNSSQEQDQPQGNRYSALSGGGDMPSNKPYDPRRSASGGSRPSSGGPRGSDKSRIKVDKDRESVLEAVRNLNKPQPTQPPPASQEKQGVKVSKEPKEPTKEAAAEAVKKPVKEPLSEEELVKKTTALIDEYANIRDLQEAITCFIDLHSPGLHHLFILTAVEHTYEMAPRARHDTGRLFAELLLRRKLSKEQVTAGFSDVLELADDNSIDYPMLWRYLADIITPVILADQFTLSDLKPLIFVHLLPVGKAAALLAEILLIIKELKGEGKAIELWKSLGLSWSEVLPERSSKEDFLSRKNLNFLPVENSDELLKLLRADEFKNDTVFAHIEKNVKEEKRKEAKFINRLVIAVAESCIINKDEEAGPECCKDKLKARKDILRKYLDNDNTLELEALFALQEVYVKYDKPAAMLSQFFNTLYDEEVLTEEAFMNWKQDESPSRQEAKGPALQATASFFEWLQAAAVEGSEN